MSWSGWHALKGRGRRARRFSTPFQGVPPGFTTIYLYNITYPQCSVTRWPSSSSAEPGILPPTRPCRIRPAAGRGRQQARPQSLPGAGGAPVGHRRTRSFPVVPPEHYIGGHWGVNRQLFAMVTAIAHERRRSGISSRYPRRSPCRRALFPGCPACRRHPRRWRETQAAPASGLALPGNVAVVVVDRSGLP